MDEDNGKNPPDRGEEGFEELLARSLPDQEELEPGQKITAAIVKITRDWVFLDLGRKGEGCLPRQELGPPGEGGREAREGDRIEAYFLGARDNELRFTTRISMGAGGQEILERAWRSGIPVEGQVVKEVKGGYEVKLSGAVTGFCPHGQMGLRGAGDTGDPVGQSLSFRILEYAAQGRRIVLSNRAILEEEREARREALRASLREGMVVRGTVTAVRDFGAFVDIGGLEGLIPVSEIAYGHVDDIHERLVPGQVVEAAVKRLDWEENRFSFSLKDVQPDPWESVERTYPVGSRHTGRVSRIVSFGVFVTLEPGVDGLIHISRLTAGRRIRHPGEVVSRGDAVLVSVEAVDRENRRLSLVRVEDADAEAEEIRGEYGRHAAQGRGALGTLGDMLKARPGKKPCG